MGRKEKQKKGDKRTKSLNKRRKEVESMWGSRKKLWQSPEKGGWAKAKNQNPDFKIQENQPAFI